MLYFSGKDCGVCDALKPKIERVFSESFSLLKRYYIDAQSHPGIAAYFTIFSVPALIVFLDGREFVREGRNMSISAVADKLGRPYGMLMTS
jgi:thioredoxin-like negative regulator of GroEL